MSLESVHGIFRIDSPFRLHRARREPTVQHLGSSHRLELRSTASEQHEIAEGQWTRLLGWILT